MNDREQWHTMAEQSNPNANPNANSRPTRWQPLAPLNPLPFHLLKAFTLVGLVGIPMGLVISAQVTLSVLTDLKNKILPFWWHSPMAIGVSWVGFFLLALGAIATSPWLIRLLLATHHPLTPLSTSTLAQSSPEAYRVIQRMAQAAKIPLPTLILIDAPFPIALSYGFAPKFATIAVSKGTLSALNDGEIAVLYAQEMAHIANWTLPLLSGAVVLQALPYSAYRILSHLGDRLLLQAQRPLRFAILGGVLGSIAKLCGVGASGVYGIYTGLRWTGLWLSRSRTEYSDRIVCNVTGNPNGMVTLLLKLTQAMRKTIVNRDTQIASVPMELELLEPLLPIALSESIHTCKIKSIGQFQTSRWWEINQSQLPLAVRLSRLATIARTWNSQPLFDRPLQPWSWKPDPVVHRWAKPWFWAVIGYAIAWVSWGIGWITYVVGWSRMAWLGSDYDLFLGLPLLGFGLGTFLRFNEFFPDLPASFFRGNGSDSLSDVILPSNGNENGLKPQLVTLSGTLAGRSGIANWIGQDLWLVTAQGDWIHLHLMGKTGAIGLILARLFNQWSISEQVGKSVLVSGWLRQGVLPWMDAEVVRVGKRMIRSEHQFASVLVGAIVTAMGLYIAL